MVTAYLGLGANIGDVEGQMRRAIRELGCENAKVSRVSSLYLSEPVGYVDQPPFLNAVVELDTCLEPLDLLDHCLYVENLIGRERTFRWGPRVIDIDVLLYDSLSLDSERLTIPHPRLTERAFVLVPLAELASKIEIAAGMSVSDCLAAVGSDGVRRIKSAGWFKQ